MASSTRLGLTNALSWETLIPQLLQPVLRPYENAGHLGLPLVSRR